MRTITRINKETQVSVGYEISKFALEIAITIAGIIGIWAAACIINSLFHGGVSETIKSFMTAVTGG